MGCGASKYDGAQGSLPCAPGKADDSAHAHSGAYEVIQAQRKASNKGTRGTRDSPDVAHGLEVKGNEFDGCGDELESQMHRMVSPKRAAPSSPDSETRVYANTRSSSSKAAAEPAAPAPGLLDHQRAMAGIPPGPTGLCRPILDKALTQGFCGLNAQIGEVSSVCIADYVWIGGTGEDVRSKQRVLKSPPKSPADLPTWNYDGSSTNQAPGEDSEVLLIPRRIFKNPFLGAPHILVMCDSVVPPAINEETGEVSEMQPIPTNQRFACAKVMEDTVVQAEEIWFGMEQEYTLMDPERKWPLGWPEGGFPGAQGPYYCGNGTGKAMGRDIAHAHLFACLYAGIEISGTNAEVMPAQWEYQVGPCIGIDMGDSLWMSRYILHRVCEEFNVTATFDPKPIPGDWNGAGLHTNVSTNGTRAAPGGFDEIKRQIKCLEKRHGVHIAGYGEGNERRLTGKHETSSMEDFSWGVANRGCSIRVGRSVPVEDAGYYEDRRPASNGCPYVITKLIAESVLLT